MESFLLHPLVKLIIDDLAWGTPYWPEVTMGLGAFLMCLWLLYRGQLRRAEYEYTLPELPVKAEEEEEVLETEPLEVEAEILPEPVEEPPVAEVIEEVEAEVAEPVLEAVVEEEEAPPAVEELVPEEEEPPTEDFLARLRRGLSRTKDAFVGRVDSLLKGAKLDEDTFEELEEALVTADLGVKTAYKLLEKIQTAADKDRLKNPDAVRKLLREEIAGILENAESPLDVESQKPFVIMVLGVNGVGKTTTIGKLAWRYRKAGKKVLLAAADTFRAAAIEQLSEWAKRAGSEIVKHEPNSDPGAVAFDALKAGIARDVDVVIIDTAGRLHTRVPLMEEIKKIKRIVDREIEGAPHEVLLVLDATTGQNAISQAETFHEALGITGIALTKLDGTAKGGVIIGICDQLNIPIRFIGIGERLDDLVDFETEPFVEALF